MGMKMEWAGREKHMRGIPRKMVFLAVGAFAKAVATLLNTTSVHNADTLLRLVRSRPPGIPLLTVSNHMSTLDDPLLWGFKVSPPWMLNWHAGHLLPKTFVLKILYSLIFLDSIVLKKGFASEIVNCAGKCIPITRGGGIYQEHMNEALQCLNSGAWLHTFPEGKVCQEDAPIRQLKWGTASLIVRSNVTPIVLPIVHSGFQEVMPERYFLNRKPPFPLCKKKIRIMIGDPLEFDIHKMMQSVVSKSRDDPIFSSTETTSRRWPVISPHGLALDEAAQRCLYSTISEQIQTAMEKLRSLGKSF